MKKRISEFDIVKLSRILAVMAADVILINLASFLALLIRFEFVWDALLSTDFLHSLCTYWPINTVVTVLIFAFCHLYTSMWEHAGIQELLWVTFGAVISSVFQILGMFLMGLMVPRSFFVFYIGFLIVLIGGERLMYRFLRKLRSKSSGAVVNVMIIGAGRAGELAIRDLRMRKQKKYRIACIIDENKDIWGKLFMGIKVVGGDDMIKKAAMQYKIHMIVLAIPSMSSRKKLAILERCQQTNCDIKVMAVTYDDAESDDRNVRIRDINIEDLLGRDVLITDMSEITAYINGKVVLVTGGGGSIGSELCRQVASHNPKQLVIFDIYENNAYEIQQELIRKYPRLNMEVMIGSVRDKARIEHIMERYKPDIVYHAAAHKHVPLMEDSPAEAIKNNVFGTLNTAQAASKYGVKRFILISTDKAVNPTNIMGASKRICEMIIQMINKSSDTEYVAVRFGNVLGSNGSVVNLFKKQIMEGGPVTVTDKRIIRYFMTIPEAVSLVLQAGAFANGGEIFVLDMGEPVKIDDLARNLIRLSGYEPDTDIQIIYTGLRPGEKLYEELLLQEEKVSKTKNNMIYIGHELDVDAAVLEKQLELLREVETMTAQEIRELISNVVPSYHLADKQFDNDDMAEKNREKEAVTV